MINIKVNPATAKQLSEISTKRKDEHHINRTKQDIVAELVNNLHKKECKNA